MPRADLTEWHTGTGLILSETQFPCRTLVACLAGTVTPGHGALTMAHSPGCGEVRERQSSPLKQERRCVPQTKLGIFGTRSTGQFTMARCFSRRKVGGGQPGLCFICFCHQEEHSVRDQRRGRGDRAAEVRGQQKPSYDPRHNQHSPGTPTTGLRERGNDTSKSTGRSGRQNAVTRRNMRREEWVTAQGPVKKQPPDGMSHGGSMVHEG